MWYHPAAVFLTKRDVIGSWLICVAVATAFFGYPAVAAAWTFGLGTATSRALVHAREKDGRPTQL
jgi:hypothetical protein